MQSSASIFFLLRMRLVAFLALAWCFLFASCTVEKRDVGDMCYLVWPISKSDHIEVRIVLPNF